MRSSSVAICSRARVQLLKTMQLQLFRLMPSALIRGWHRHIAHDQEKVYVEAALHAHVFVSLHAALAHLMTAFHLVSSFLFAQITG